MIKQFLLCTLILVLVCELAAQQYGSFKDPRDGQVYKTVIIRDQEWMSENLNTIKFRNGDLIPEAKTWEELVLAEKNKKPAWYAANLDRFINPNSMSIGKFYNWYAVIDPRELAPQGWNIPTNIEWEKLRKGDNGDPELDPVADYWTKKEDWIHLGVDHNDIYSEERGFSGLPTSNIGLVPIGAYWWSKTQFDTKEANVFCIGVADFLFDVSKFPKYYSLSVRCVRGALSKTISNSSIKNNTSLNNDNVSNQSSLFNCADLMQTIKTRTERTKINFNGNTTDLANDIIERIVKPGYAEYITQIISNANREVSVQERNQIAADASECLKKIDWNFNSTNNNKQATQNNSANNKYTFMGVDLFKLSTLGSATLDRESSNSSVKPKYGDVNTNNYNIPVNAWQCSKCGVLSRDKNQPNRYDFGNCSIGSYHTWGEANTGQGYQCKQCSRKYYLLNKGRSERGPCCGELGDCTRGSSQHDWRRF